MTDPFEELRHHKASFVRTFVDVVEEMHKAGVELEVARPLVIDALVQMLLYWAESAEPWER